MARFEHEALGELQQIRHRLGCLVAIGLVGLILLGIMIHYFDSGVRIYFSRS
jgi:hypothetical protein